MATPRKYLFDLSFDHPQGPVAVKFARSPQEPTYTKADLDAARAEAAAAARMAALAEATADTEARLANAVEMFAAGVPSLLERSETIRLDVERRAIELLRALVAKATPALARKEPLAEIETLVIDCLREVFEEPRIVLRVPEALFDATRQRLGALAQQSGFGGKFVLLADPALGPVDCRLEWADGGAERDVARLQREIDGVLARTLVASIPAPAFFTKDSDHE